MHLFIIVSTLLQIFHFGDINLIQLNTRFKFKHLPLINADHLLIDNCIKGSEWNYFDSHSELTLYEIFIDKGSILWLNKLLLELNSFDSLFSHIS